MDIASVAGLIVAAGGIIYAMYVGAGGDFTTFYSPEAMVVVVGGSVAAACLSLPLRSVLNVGDYLKKIMFHRERPVEDLVRQLVNYAEIARRDGMLALEEVIKRHGDPFLTKGLQLAIDGTDPEIIEETMHIELDALADRHRNGRKFFELVGKYGPGFGLTCTLIGQVSMFRSMGADTESVGRGLAVALLATLYGCILCNVLCGPMADKLAVRSQEERFVKEMVLTGIMSIQAGDNPHVVEMKLYSFLSEPQKLALERKKG